MDLQELCQKVRERGELTIKQGQLNLEQLLPSLHAAQIHVEQIQIDGDAPGIYLRTKTKADDAPPSILLIQPWKITWKLQYPKSYGAHSGLQPDSKLNEKISQLFTFWQSNYYEANNVLHLTIQNFRINLDAYNAQWELITAPVDYIAMNRQLRKLKKQIRSLESSNGILKGCRISIALSNK